MLSILEFIDGSGVSETTTFEGPNGQGDGEILVFFKGPLGCEFALLDTPGVHGV